MYKISKLNQHNTNSLNLIPGMTAVCFDNGLTTTAHQCHIHVPRHSFNMSCVIPFHPSIRNCYIHVNCNGKRPSILTILPMTSQLRLIEFRSGDLDDQGMSLQKAQSRVCDMRSRAILRQAHTPVMSKSLRFV